MAAFNCQIRAVISVKRSGFFLTIQECSLQRIIVSCRLNNNWPSVSRGVLSSEIRTKRDKITVQRSGAEDDIIVVPIAAIESKECSISACFSHTKCSSESDGCLVLCKIFHQISRWISDQTLLHHTMSWCKKKCWCTPMSWKYHEMLSRYTVSPVTSKF